MIAAIMPCRGRAEQTVTNLRRMIATAGPVEYQLICVVDRDPVVLRSLADADLPVWSIKSARPGYWHALKQATDYWPEFAFVANLANDLLPGQYWLTRAFAAYRQTFGDGPGMIGFNDGHHEVDHSCHMLISRSLLERYGGWPVWYNHTYGDTELCARAIEDGVYAKAPWATLFHDHPYFGGQDDGVYAEGRAGVDRDARLYVERRQAGWPLI
jgi:hypothetical protein